MSAAADAAQARHANIVRAIILITGLAALLGLLVAAGFSRGLSRPFAAQQALLVTIPGVDALTAAAIIAEIGVDMAAFGTARRLAAWAGLCPANHESAGKRTKRGTRKGDPHLKAALVTAAVCAARTKGGTYLRDKFHRLRARMGAKKAAVAVAHRILVAVFHMLRRAVAFADLGADYLDRLDKHRTAKRLVRRLGELGYEVMLRPKAAG